MKTWASQLFRAETTLNSAKLNSRARVIELPGRRCCCMLSQPDTVLRVHGLNCINSVLNNYQVPSIKLYQKEPTRTKKYKKVPRSTKSQTLRVHVPNCINSELWTATQLRVESSGPQLEGNRTLGALLHLSHPPPHHHHQLGYHEAKEVEGVAW